ncbi:hypothetical protein B0H67DRAFT_547774 [Lasiosphaeris hirsuta]|uniref:Dienelactone hydrolase n=1 Tax=Lasiosphaeris hirsuta TaxID=260670 RepID=A0AA40B8P3_9PEZI|nr:hypothetical protein B0H67DRAFT_547774 [Lasiosphaeris hirsuta]
MNVDTGNVSDLVRAALPNKSRNKNIGILKDNWTGAMNHNDPGFLSDDFPRSPPKLYITAESDEFDAATLAAWRAEGFQVEYLAMHANPDAYRRTLRTLHRKSKLGPCETFGIVAYGDAASLCLEHFHVLDNNPEMKLGCLIAYYPTRIPDPSTRFPSSIRVLVHVVVGDVGVVKQTQMVGIQGKRRVVKQNIDRGAGVGGTLQAGYPLYAYEAEAGFAEHDLEEYDRICAELAWSRSLAKARRAFRNDVDVEAAVEANAQAKFYARDVDQTMATYTPTSPPHVTHVPTLSGGFGADDLEEFYHQYFINSNPPSMEITLLSRTIGVDRVVDEMYVSFKHTQDMPWILPGVPPTKKRVEIILVSIVTLRGGKLHHEHLYWDQASVLVQVGLLDPKVVPQRAQDRGVERLPVVGKKAARRVFSGGDEDEDGEADNELIYAWEDSLGTESGGSEEEESESEKVGGVGEEEDDLEEADADGEEEEEEEGDLEELDGAGEEEGDLEDVNGVGEEEEGDLEEVDGDGEEELAEWPEPAEEQGETKSESKPRQATVEDGALANE